MRPFLLIPHSTFLNNAKFFFSGDWMQKIAQVHVNIPTKAINKAFSYLLPLNLQYLDVGWRVLVPFGNRKIEGFILKTEMSHAEGLKSVIEPLDDLPWFDENMLKTSEWMSRYYLCSLSEAMRLFIPGKTGLKSYLTYHVSEHVPFDQAVSALSLKADQYAAVYQYLVKNGPATLLQIQKTFPDNCLKILNDLIGKKLIFKDYRVNKQTKPKYISILSRAMDKEAFQDHLRSIVGKPAQQRLMNALLEKELLDNHDLKQLNVSADTIKRLVMAGLITVEKRRLMRDSYSNMSVSYSKISLNQDQEIVLGNLLSAIHDQSYQSFLLHGITGSGKTQVYIEAVAEVRRKGRQAIVLVPEIALTSQIVARFRARFHDDIVVMHSKLSVNERNDAIQRLRIGQAGIVIGARSAIFAPLEDLGIVIIDEEHEFTYKQEETPRYHTREVAFKRAQFASAVVVLGSATPAIETYYEAVEHKHILLEMPNRADGASLPAIELVDMREELRRGRRNVISLPLQNLIHNTIEQGEQVIILLNRRGYSTFVMCRECGYVISCNQCAVSMVYHKAGHLRCHYCQSSVSPPDVCPSCASRYIRYFGTGTQRLEDELVKLFPHARMIRMDQDTTGSKMAHDRILQSFAQGNYDILLGTQMVAKGHDIKNVTAVGIITADSVLNLPDFRAAERTFSLLTQAAGRAGRGELSGKVIIQTYNPEHYAIEDGAKQDYKAFYDKEIAFRKSLDYPPFSKITKLTITAPGESEVRHKAETIAADLRVALGDNSNFIQGPFLATIAKINNNFRMNILIKSLDHSDVNQHILRLNLHIRSDIIIDIDPLNVM